MIKSILSLLKEEDKTVSRMNALEDTFINHRESETSFLSRQVEATESIIKELTELINATSITDSSHFLEMLESEQKQLERIRPEYISWHDAESYTDIAEYKELEAKRKSLKEAIRKELFE